ncbi:MAG: imidazole glycerol phosphate synthase subunit HisH [Myxococcota bacterium]
MTSSTSPGPRVAVVDYGAGNLRSVSRALERSGMTPVVTGDASELTRADAIVLPGVGAFADAVGKLQAQGLDSAVRKAIESGTPYLGLCLGLQLLFEECDEHGVNAGLGLLAGRVERFPDPGQPGAPPHVPHIGWNAVQFQGDHPVTQRLGAGDTYYFVHSYRAVPKDEAILAGTVDYGAPFAAAVARDNVFAVQFHPEKSQSAGRRLLDAFAAWIAS